MEFPTKIKMSGLPFMLQGWNNTYYITNQTSDGCPVYKLAPYNLYYMIGIIGTRILRIDGIWRIQRDCDSAPTDIYKYGAKPQGDPFGHWTNGGVVTPL